MNRLRVSVYQACANALAQWLTGELTNDVRVEPRWVEGTVPAPRGEDRSITILLTGAPQVDLEDPQVDPDARVITVDAHTKRYTWMVRAFRQPLQLDVWTKYDVQRDDLVAQLDDALNAGTRRTLFGTAAAFNGSISSNGILLALEDGWTGFASIYFDGPNNLDTLDSNQQSQFRTMYTGWADAILTVEAESAPIANIELRKRMSQVFPVPSSTPTDTTHVTASS